MNGMEMLNVKDTKNKYKKGKERKKKEKMFSSKKLKLKYVNIISICFFLFLWVVELHKYPDCPLTKVTLAQCFLTSSIVCVHLVLVLIA